MLLNRYSTLYGRSAMAFRVKFKSANRIFSFIVSVSGMSYRLTIEWALIHSLNDLLEVPFSYIPILVS